MSRVLQSFIFLCIMCIMLLITIAAAHAQEGPEGDVGEDLLEETPLVTPAGEGEEEGEATPISPRETPEEEPAEETPPEEAAPPEEVELSRSIVIDGVVTLNYVFDNANESFVVKYSFHLEGDAPANTAIVKGDADVSASVNGYLAKWPTGECKLDVMIPKIPFELSFRAASEERGSLNLRF